VGDEGEAAEIEDAVIDSGQSCGIAFDRVEGRAGCRVLRQIGRGVPA
jgi:hypothetical protein